MLKKVSPIFMAAMLVLIVNGLAFTSVSAQKGVLDPNTPVSNRAGMVTYDTTHAGYDASFEPFKGTGKLAPETARVVGPHTRVAPMGDINPESVIGADGRTQPPSTTTFPSRAIAYLVVTWANDIETACTGWFIGPRTVATAGHCVFNTFGGDVHGWAKAITIYPGRAGATIPYGSTTAHRLFSALGWTNSANSSFDYGAIQTTEAVGYTVGWFKWAAVNTFSGSYVVQGYPGDKPEATQWKMGGAISDFNDYRLWYYIDTAGGQSGSPLYKVYNGKCCYGFGIHTYAASMPPYLGNSATRINAGVSKNFTNWRKQPYP